MPTWGEILQEFQAGASDPHTPDAVRRKYLSSLSRHTGRAVILYSTRWTNPGSATPDTISITEEDLQGFMEVVNGLRGGSVDLVLHSPGGSPVATEAIVKYLRKKFTDIRVIIPQGAMSAGTMLACSGNQIVMGKQSFLGPIDPQFILQTQLGARMVPAQAILDQFDMAQRECKDTEKLASWLPILSQYGPGLLVECKNAIALSKRLVKDWLCSYMFAGQKRASWKAAIAARCLADHQKHKSHGRHLDRDDCKKLRLNIFDLEIDQTFQDLVLSVFHASTLTFTVTPAAKIIENQNGKAFIKISGTVQVRKQLQPAPAAPVVPPRVPSPIQPQPAPAPAEPQQIPPQVPSPGQPQSTPSPEEPPQGETS